MTRRDYPVHIQGRIEMLWTYNNFSSMVNTTTYMQENFSLGSSTLPLGGIGQTNQFYATYKQTEETKTFKDAAPVFCKFFTDDSEIGTRETSADGAYSGEKYQKSLGWLYSMQKDNTVMIAGMPSLQEPVCTDTLKLGVVFPVHYGSITASIIGNNQPSPGISGQSDKVGPVSVEAGLVYMHIQPLLPTSLPRKAAIRFKKVNDYAVLELVNYEGETREFTEIELSHALNGFVFTIEDKSKFASLQEFHDKMSNNRIVDFMFNQHRFINFKRDDVDFDFTMSMTPFGDMVF